MWLTQEALEQTAAARSAPEAFRAIPAMLQKLGARTPLCAACGPCLSPARTPPLLTLGRPLPRRRPLHADRAAGAGIRVPH